MSQSRRLSTFSIYYILVNDIVITETLFGSVLWTAIHLMKRIIRMYDKFILPLTFVKSVSFHSNFDGSAFLLNVSISAKHCFNSSLFAWTNIESANYKVFSLIKSLQVYSTKLYVILLCLWFFTSYKYLLKFILHFNWSLYFEVKVFL
jgi:hypothetical protein